MDPKKIGKFICELRKEKELSQYELADMIPISRQGVSKWERGVTTPDTQILIQLSELFNVTIDELLRGERSENNSIEKLEETTLSILSQSNKKTKTIKRITLISISIIVILLLSFLSYYFINSYNSIEIYKIGNTNDKFTTTNGIFITTSENYYLKLGKIKNKINADINNIKLYYKKDNKKIIIMQTQDLDNITVIDSYGYKNYITRKEIKTLINNLYLEINYNENQKETVKLRYRRDYKNSSLFFLKQKQDSTKKFAKLEESAPIEEIKQEEVQPTIHEEQKNEKSKQNDTPPNKEEQETPEEQPPEPEITTEQIINKINETCDLEDKTYACYYDNYHYAIMYYEDMKKIVFYENFNLIGTFNFEIEEYICNVDNCKSKTDDIINNYLFK
ncbi:MAG: helix-turn-helix transcriptional regulator [Bacilli bacterium]|nr:helix-turn-helix transcriptional regulator [Bacilli bacterium]